MKKLVFMFAVMFTAIFASCGNSTKSANSIDSIEADPVEIDSLDSVSVDTLNV